MSALPTVRAPGKAFLFGEYAVLGGAPALVAAVDRYVTARPAPVGDRAPETAFVREAQAELVAERGRRGLPVEPALRRVSVDSTPLYASGARGRKLGLGSSAAVTVAAIGHGCVWGAQPDLPREALWRIAQEAHSRAQGARGSGADLAAAIWGGVICFQRRPQDGRDGRDSCDVREVTLASDLAVTLVDSGVPAATGPRVERLATLEETDPARHRRLTDPLAALARAVADEALARGTIDPEAVRAWNAALDELAAAIDLPILTEPLRAIAACAEAVGGAAKPSGAGGGDLAVCFTSREAAPALAARLAALGFEALAVTVGAPGLHRLPDPVRRADLNGAARRAPTEAAARPDRFDSSKEPR